MRHGTTSQQLGNVLSKDKDIVKVGYIKRSGILSGGYDICEWATRIWVEDNCPGWKEGTLSSSTKMATSPWAMTFPRTKSVQLKRLH